MHNKKLDFIVIGAQKCATSWLYYCLRDHPQIVLPRDKYEPGYIGGEVFRREGESWFFDRFPAVGAGVKRGDVSVDYLYDLAAAPASQAYAHEGTKFIASLRHPVSRAISSYYWYVRRKSLPLQDPNVGLGPILEAQAGFPEPLEGFYEQIVRRSCYAAQLENYLNHYDSSQIIVMDYESLNEDNLREVQALYRHLGVLDDFVPPSLSAKTKKNAYNPWLLRLERINNNKLSAKLANYTNQLFVFLGLGRSPEISSDVLARLQELFEPEVERTREVLARLPVGQRPSDLALESLWGKPVKFKS